MTRQNIALAVFLTALPLLFALPGYFLQERQGPVEPAVGADVVNRGRETIWLTGDTVDHVLLRIASGDSDETCRLRADDVRVYDSDPTVDPPPDPLFTLRFGDRDFCDGTYRWDGSTLDRVE